MTLLDATPRRATAVVTCMDARIDALAVLGLELGDAHVLRNAGGRVTDDVLRSLQLSVGGFGVSTIIVMEHTECGAGIDDHLAALCDDVDRLVATASLESVEVVLGLLHDVTTGTPTELVRCERHAGATPTKHGFATLPR